MSRGDAPPQKIGGFQQFRADLLAHIERFERWLEEREQHQYIEAEILP